ncbi:MAG TPA: hopanoid biosynthesis-associated protein HpnK [Planctomycetaceae bacterium]|nr:hopanoid biosynthesis-associated protein HpnK [Planctomycetaceae bacterium]
MNSRLIVVNADDFGRSSDVNAAVVRAHREGLVSSASLMVTGDAFEEAVALARQNPRLAVGLHLVLSDGRAALPAARISHLVDESGQFLVDPVVAGWHYFLRPHVRTELADEVAAQFERFAATGLPLSHVDGHQHLHAHPSVFRTVLSLAEEHRAVGVRIPHDDLSLSLRFSRKHAARNLSWSAVWTGLSAWCRVQLHGRRLISPRRTYGFFQTGEVTSAYLQYLAPRIQGPVELYLHPTLGARVDPLGPNFEDFAAVSDPAAIEAFSQAGLEPATYAQLARPEQRSTRLSISNSKSSRETAAQTLRRV